MRFTSTKVHGMVDYATAQGVHLGRSLAAHIREGAPLAPVRYDSRGNTAIVGRHAAVFEQGNFKAKGWFAWLAWAVIHVYLLVGFQHRFLVSMQWLWRYLTYDRGARLIAGDDIEAFRPGLGPDPPRPAAPRPRTRRRRDLRSSRG